MDHDESSNRTVGPGQPAPGATAGAPAVSGAGTRVTVRYWAGARAAAGCDADETAPGPLAAVLDEVHALHPGLATVTAMSSVLRDGRTLDRDAVLGPGDVIEVLPPFAGG